MSAKRNQVDRDGSDSAAHDVLAAEAFAVPEADPTIRSRPVVLPDDPTGIPEPHDVLAAEAFAMPALRAHPGPPKPRGLLSPSSRLVAAGLLLLLLLLRLRKRA